MSEITHTLMKCASEGAEHCTVLGWADSLAGERSIHDLFERFLSAGVEVCLFTDEYLGCQTKCDTCHKASHVASEILAIHEGRSPRPFTAFMRGEVCCEAVRIGSQKVGRIRVSSEKSLHERS